MKTTIYTTILLLTITAVSCKKQNGFADYKYADKPLALECSEINSKLYNEALYSFEDDIFNYYDKDRKSSLLMVYSRFLRQAIYHTAKYQEMVSPHTLKVFEALKQQPDLWDQNNPVSHLNYNGPLMDCILKNMKDKDLKTTLNALLTTHSMSPKLFGAPIIANYRLTMSDKALASYVAFDLYYSKLFDVDLSQTEQQTPN